MRRPWFFRTVLAVLSLAQLSFAGHQSLADAARRESERRKALEEQGIEGKTISGQLQSVTDGSVPQVTGPAPVRSASGRSLSARKQPSLQALRTTLQKLDLEIQHGEERLALLRARMESEKWQLPKIGRNSRGGSNNSARERLGFQIKELEAKMKHWRRERSATYESGRKAGFLPGELDGKGVMP
ncbi:MAG TPA: hypothetical protein VE398_18055 [Acidobacteriota bacterium]|nr:hypothetical protein [Acidobacteriota bacterium]